MNQKTYNRIIDQALRSLYNVKAPINDYQRALEYAIEKFTDTLDASLESDGDQR